MSKRKNNTFKDFFIKFMISGFGTGYSPIVSGTVGTVAGVAIFMLIGYYPFMEHQLTLYAIVTLILFLVGIPWSTIGEKVYYKKKDPGQIVIDEEVGYLVTMAGTLGGYSATGVPVPTNLLLIGAGFILFRIFDIVKPYPIRRIEKLGGGLGIMLDDVVAGIYAFLCMMLLQYLIRENPESIGTFFVNGDAWIKTFVPFL